MDDLPAWVAEWCRRELGAAPVEVLMSAEVMSDVRALQLEDGRSVVLKARLDADARRASICVGVQRILAEQGFACSRPLTGVSAIGHLAVHAEEWRPGGDIDRGDGPDAAGRSARLLADLMTRLERIHADEPLPNPEWVRWDHDGPGLFPANPRHDPVADRTPLPEVIEETASRVRARLLGTRLVPTLGHADWEAQNLRWHGTQAHAVHDWDSLAWLSEAAVVGAAAGAFASGEVPTLAPLESSEAFLEAYTNARGRAFASEETGVAWAASLWTALHNARGEVLYAQPPTALAALEQQAERRLELAGA